MPATAARPSGSIGENISHTMGVRMRIVGKGNLICSLRSLEDEKIVVNPNPLVLKESTSIQPLKKFNFMSQRTSFKMQTKKINEWFRVNRIIVFTKTVFTQYPQ